MFIPEKIYYEQGIENYELGKELLEKYKEVPKVIIDNHNNIEEMRKKENSEFPKMKRNLIIGTRKTHKYVPNFKVSNFLVPYTSSGCIAMCMYCYLVCNYNKCAYLRLFVNREEIINKCEFGTSRLKQRREAINKLVEADYKVGILVAPIILLDNWKILYEQLFKELTELLTEKAKKRVFFEFIFMTYSYIHKMINSEAFPNAIDLYNKELMTVRGKGKYTYNKFIRQEGEMFFRDLMSKYFFNNEIIYFS